MLQSLGVSTAAEALYLVLAPLESASAAHLAELNNVHVDESIQSLMELQTLGLARPD